MKYFAGALLVIAGLLPTAATATAPSSIANKSWLCETYRFTSASTVISTSPVGTVTYAFLDGKVYAGSASSQFDGLVGKYGYADGNLSMTFTINGERAVVVYKVQGFGKAGVLLHAVSDAAPYRDLLCST